MCRKALRLPVSAELKLESERSRRYGNRLSLLMIDVDHFKKINDQFGHVTGRTQDQ